MLRPSGTFCKAPQPGGRCATVVLRSAESTKVAQLCLPLGTGQYRVEEPSYPLRPFPVHVGTEDLNGQTEQMIAGFAGWAFCRIGVKHAEKQRLDIVGDKLARC